MRTVTITESGNARLELTADEALALQEAGRRLASDKQWWGDEGIPVERTVIRCQHLPADDWLVTVNNAVGVVVIGDTLQINVLSKIPNRTCCTSSASPTCSQEWMMTEDAEPSVNLCGK